MFVSSWLMYCVMTNFCRPHCIKSGCAVKTTCLIKSYGRSWNVIYTYRNWREKQPFPPTHWFKSLCKHKSLPINLYGQNHCVSSIISNIRRRGGNMNPKQVKSFQALYFAGKHSELVQFSLCHAENPNPQLHRLFHRTQWLCPSESFPLRADWNPNLICMENKIPSETMVSVRRSTAGPAESAAL